MVDKFALVAVKCSKGEVRTAVNILKSPGMGLVEEGIPVHPPRGDIRSGEREDIGAFSNLSAVVSD
jgi:hypothetical protein